MIRITIRFLLIGVLGVMSQCVDAEIIGSTSSDGQPSAESFDTSSANTSLLLTARQTLQRNELATCRQLLKEAVNQDPSLVHPEVLIAQWLLEAGQPAKAIAIMEQLAVTDPDRADLRLVYAQVSLSQGRLFDAWLHATAAEQAELPEEWSDEFRDRFRRDALRTKAITATRRAQPTVAKSLYEQLIQRYKQPGDYLSLANIELALGNDEAAETNRSRGM